jgi:DNA-binding SARP family transcriptional activator
MTDRLKIWTLGGLTIKRGETSLDGLVPHKAAALLVYLACSGRPQPRQVLANLFWDEGPEARVMNNLRVLLTNLRRELDPYVAITRETVAFNQASPHWLDVAALEKNLDAVRLGLHNLCSEEVARLAQVLRLYQGDFLAGLHLHGSLGFEEWLVLERERLRLQTLEALHQLITATLALGEYQIGLEYVGHLLQLDPLHEGAHYQKMCLLAASGQRYAALAQYEHYCQLLADELGVEPAAETMTLCEELRAGKLCPVNWSAIDSSPLLSLPVSTLPPCPYRGRCLLAKMIDLFSFRTR